MRTSIPGRAALHPGARRSGRGAGAGVAALLAAAGLLLTAVPAQAAAGPATAPPPDVVPGAETETPSLVEGIREAADPKASPADAARKHLDAKESRYRISDARRDLAPLQTVRRGAEETVRLQQKHRGVPVFGGQYVVRMEAGDGERFVTGTSGKYFTGLKTGTEATVSEETAVRRAVAATAARLADKRLAKADAPRKGEQRTDRAAALTGTARGLVVIPRGEGVLARQVTVRGTDTATGEPVLQQVFIDARAGFPVLQFSGIKTMTDRAENKGRAAAAALPGDGTDDPAPKEFPGVQGTGERLDGAQTGLELTRTPSGDRFLMNDFSRMWGSSRNALSTWDARDRDVSEVAGAWPSGLGEFAHPTPEFGKEATESGAVDAHWAAGRVYDYFKDRHGRDSLDGRGMAVNSLVGVTDFGFGYVNAFWDGQKMVYGSGDEAYKPLSADLDVVGHEMTHGVVDNSADLVYAGQSGALNEAVADYFGNAIDLAASGMPMDHPDAGLIGEDLCRDAAPRDCAFRDLNDGASTSKNFLGVAFGTDNGGVHLNSTIFSGALWDMREDLGGDLADKIVYKALTEYMTPLDGFTDGRNAVLAAARDLGVAGKRLGVVKRSFNAHGIVSGWENALGVDSDRLLGRLNIAGTGAQAGGGRWVVSQSNDDGSEPYTVWSGRTDGRGHPKLMSPNDGRYHVMPATDGKTVVWAAYGASGIDVLSRPAAGGPTKKLYTTDTDVSGLRVENGTVVFETFGLFGDRHVGYLRPGDRKPVWADGGGWTVLTALPSIKNGKIAYAKLYPEGGDYKLGVEILDPKTGNKILAEQLEDPWTLGQTGLNSTHAFWLTDENVQDDGQMSIRRSGVDGTGAMDISPERKPHALFPDDLTVSETAVTVSSTTPGLEWSNEALSKLWQLTTDGSRQERVSCNRGEQLSPAAVSGRQVVWLDGTTGWTDLVTRERPAGRCG
ncbi:M4 family metallopeptidase [Streptomyces chengmaiensis]|uniref:M4 family metallopeptidase n=1 Tax=Streptomyces chengmaiensis TaxID=3040919 RepID=UPI0037D9D591